MRPGGLVRMVLGAALLLGGTAGAARVYRVQAGDTLWSLARTNGTTIQNLLDLNDRSSSVLRVNEVILLPDRGAALPSSPAVTRLPLMQRGQAVYYPGRQDTRTTMTAAHLTLPKGTWVRVTHTVTGRSVDVLINDRGPFGVPSRIIDLSAVAAGQLGILSEGVAPVTLTVLRQP